jgi:hypothetical protein
LVNQVELDEWTQQTKNKLQNIRKMREINNIFESYHDNQDKPLTESEAQLNEHLKNYIFKNDPEND